MGQGERLRLVAEAGSWYEQPDRRVSHLQIVTSILLPLWRYENIPTGPLPALVLLLPTSAVESPSYSWGLYPPLRDPALFPCAWGDRVCEVWSFLPHGEGQFPFLSLDLWGLGFLDVPHSTILLLLPSVKKSLPMTGAGVMLRRLCSALSACETWAGVGGEIARNWWPLRLWFGSSYSD